MTIDGSSTPVEFIITPSSGKKFIMTRLSFTIEDEAINFTKFGGISALSNGCDLLVKEGGEAERNLSAQGALKTNAQFYIAGLSTHIQSETTDLLNSVIVFTEMGTSLVLKDSLSEYFKIVINDDLTNIKQFILIAQGYEVDE